MRKIYLHKRFDSFKKGDKIFVVVKDIKKQKVNVLNVNGKKTAKKVSTGSTFTAKAVKKTNGKKIVKINKSQQEPMVER